MKQWYVPTLVCLALVACSDDGSDASQSAADGGTAADAAAQRAHAYYEHVIPGCESDGLVNCAPSIELCEDGTGTVLVTDILNPIDHQRTGEQVEITRDGPGDIPETFSLELTSDGQLATDDWVEWEWALVENPPFSTCD